MVEPYGVSAGREWRFSAYELRDGYIRPTPEAQLETYDPWAVYAASLTKKPAVEAPYTSLLALLDKVLEGATLSPSAPDPLYRLSAAAEAAITSWCRQFGLLGVLLQRVQAITLWPRWEPVEWVSPPLPRRLLFPAVTQYARSSTGWSKADSPMTDTEPRTDLAQTGALVAETDWPTRLPRPGVVLRDLRSPAVKVEGLDGTWSRFFPGVPAEERDTFAYPQPLTDAFWRLYAEPVDAFIDGALMLRDALGGLKLLKPLAEASEREASQLDRARNLLQTLIWGTSPVLKFTAEGAAEPVWVAPSLLGALAMMAFLDLTESRRRLRRCEVCGRLFVSTAWQATYCSAKCRHTAQKRANRARQRNPEGHEHLQSTKE